MAKIGAAIEAAIARITKKQIQPAVKELRATVRRMQKVIEKQARSIRGRNAGSGRPGRPPGSRTDAGPPMAPREVKALRARLGMTQAEFARATGVTHVAVYFWESGRTKPGGDRLLRLRELEKGGSGKRSTGRAASAAKPGPKKKAAKKTTKKAARKKS